MGRATIIVLLVLPLVLALVRTDWRGMRIKRIQWTSYPTDTKLLLLACAITCIVWLTSSALSIYPLKSLNTWARTLALVLMGYLLTNALAHDKHTLSTAVKALVTSSSIILCLAIITLYFNEAIFDAYRAIKGDGAIPLQTLKPYFSVAICILPVVLWSGWHEKGIWRTLAILHIPLTVLLIYGRGEQPGLSASFGLASSALLLGIVCMLKQLSYRAAWSIIVIIFLATLYSAFFIISNLPTPPVSAAPNPTIGFPDWHRQVIWGFVVEIIKDTPVLGVGPNTVNLVPGANEQIPSLNQEYIPSHPHNWVLEIAAETGFLGVSALIITLLLGLKKLSSFILSEDPAPAWAAIALYGAFWSSSLGNFSIWSVWWLAVFIVLMCFPLAAILMQEQSRAFREK